MDTLVNELLVLVKIDQNITFTYHDERLKGHIRSGMSLLRTWTGFDSFKAEPTDDFEQLALTLLLNYCRYALNGGERYFRRDYRDLILNLQMWKVKAYVSKAKK